jgi:hypothetical protein
MGVLEGGVVAGSAEFKCADVPLIAAGGPT